MGLPPTGDLPSRHPLPSLRCPVDDTLSEPSRGRLLKTLYAQKVDTRWCPKHDNEIKRGTRRCRTCTVDLAELFLPIRPRLMVDPTRLRPMRAAGQTTKRARRRFLKERVR